MTSCQTKCTTTITMTVCDNDVQVNGDGVGMVSKVWCHVLLVRDDDRYAIVLRVGVCQYVRGCATVCAMCDDDGAGYVWCDKCRARCMMMSRATMVRWCQVMRWVYR